MDDQSKSTRGKSDHWDLLASTLGAIPSPESAEPAESPPQPQPSQPAPSQLPEESPSPPSSADEASLGPSDLVVVSEPVGPPEGEAIPAVSQEIVSETPQESRPPEAQDLLASLPQSTFVPPRPDRQKTPQDWARLASQLGVELPPESFEPVEATAATTLEPSPRPSIVVTTLETGPWAADKSAAKPHAEESRAARRRGQRRRKPLSAAGSAFGQSLHEPAVGDAELEEASATHEDLDDLLLAPEEPIAGPEPPDVSEVPAPDSTAPTAAGSQTAAPPRGKRRRRRKKKPASHGPDTAEAALAQARERVESIEDRAFDADAHLAESGDADLPDDTDHTQSDETEDEKGGIHRSIPTWEEAVGIIIAANMEARAKNPERRPLYSPRGRNR